MDFANQLEDTCFPAKKSAKNGNSGPGDAARTHTQKTSKSGYRQRSSLLFGGHNLFNSLSR